MKRNVSTGSTNSRKKKASQWSNTFRGTRRRHAARPAAAYRQRGLGGAGNTEAFNAPEVWHEPTEADDIRYIVEPAGAGCLHPVTIDEIAERIAQIPDRFTGNLEVVQLSKMTRKRAIFPCYGMQWGSSVYLYPIEESLVEIYVRPPKPQQLIEARMFGGRWEQEGSRWRLRWTKETIKDFYLNNVLIHEIGHIYDDRNTAFEARERFANAFAVKYGYRASRGRR